MVGEHSGKNQVAVLIALFKEYGIGGNIGYFMANNAESNDICVNVILQALYPNISVKM